MTSRANPSARFRELEGIYARVHTGGLSQSDNPEPASVFAGNSLLPFVDDIRELIVSTRSKTLLDYGCGKGVIHKLHKLMLPNGKTVGSLNDYWGIDRITLFDPGVEAYAQLPTGPFDGVISTDVLEHVPEEDIPWVLKELFDFADRFVFANIASYPATKTLPNGWNAHVTIKPADWWREKIMAAAEGWRGAAYRFVVSEKRSGLGRVAAKLTGQDKMKRTEIRPA
jgi:hypothetical protein